MLPTHDTFCNNIALCCDFIRSPTEFNYSPLATYDYKLHRLIDKLNNKGFGFMYSEFVDTETGQILTNYDYQNRLHRALYARIISRQHGNYRKVFMYRPVPRCQPFYYYYLDDYGQQK